MAYELKLEDGKPILGASGGIVYTKEDGSDVELNAGDAMAKITELSNENKTRRVDNVKLTKDFDAYKQGWGEMTPDQAKEAIDRAVDFNKDDFVPKSQHEAMLLKVTGDFDSYKTVSEKEKSDLIEKGHVDVLGRLFSEAEIFKKIGMPSDVGLSHYGSSDHFRFDDNGKPYGIDANGNTIISEINIGQTADVAECLARIISARSDYNSLLKDSGGGSGGAGGSNNGGGFQEKVSGVDRVARGLKNR
ncbi:MAG: hypothetical protein IMF04_00970 [Proteobacteria bacterium]|nr:hypothetical protein [Pseudomonadota bacterium]